ncbi:MAG: uridine kinase family protein [Candidatus Nanopelagicales bacterium]
MTAQRVTAAGPETLERIAAAAGASAPGCGPVRVICIDGPAGSGKTTLAAALAAQLAAPVIHLDDLYQGWAQNLSALGPRLEAWLLTAWSAGLPGQYLRYDWSADRYCEWVCVPPAPVVLLEGCGSGSRRVRAAASLLVWVEAPAEVCLRRGLERDGERLREQWVAWQAAEQRHFVAEGTRAAADLVVGHAPGEGGR